MEASDVWCPSTLELSDALYSVINGTAGLDVIEHAAAA